MTAARHQLAATMVLGLTLTACVTTGDDMPTSQQQTSTSDGGEEGPTTEVAGRSAAPTDVDLTASITATAETATAPEGFTSGLEGVLVSYTVTNEGAEPIKVAQDRAASQAPSAAQAPAGVWVSAGSEADVVRLSKQVFGIPDGVLPNEVHRAASTTVEPGASAEDTAFVPLELRTDLPSGSETITVTESPLADPGAARRLEVCVQIAPGPPAGQEEPYASTIAADAQDTALVCSEPIMLPGGER